MAVEICLYCSLGEAKGFIFNNMSFSLVSNTRVIHIHFTIYDQFYDGRTLVCKILQKSIDFGRQINVVIYQVQNEVLFIDYESFWDRVLHVY